MTETYYDRLDKQRELLQEGCELVDRIPSYDLNDFAARLVNAVNSPALKGETEPERRQRAYGEAYKIVSDDIEFYARKAADCVL